MMETITIDIDKDVLYELMLMAHERDITFNALVIEILTEYVEKHKKTNTSWDNWKLNDAEGIA